MPSNPPADDEPDLSWVSPVRPLILPPEVLAKMDSLIKAPAVPNPRLAEAFRRLRLSGRVTEKL